LSWFSDKPITDVSIVPETERAEVLKEGGTVPWCFTVGLSAGLGGSFAFGGAAAKGILPILEIIFMRLVVGVKLG
jgi:hypothetical protein